MSTTMRNSRHACLEKAAKLQEWRGSDDTIFIFEYNRSDCINYYIFGEDTVLISNEISGVNILKSSIKVRGNNHPSSNKENEWVVIREGTPSDLNDFESIIEEAALLNSFCSIIFVRFTNNRKFNEVIEVTHFNDQDYCFSTFIVPYDPDLQNLENTIIKLSVDKVLLIEEDSKIEPRIIKEFKYILSKNQIFFEFLKDGEVQEVSEAKSIITNLISNSEEINQLFDSMVVNLYILLKNVGIIDDDLSDKQGLLCYRKCDLEKFVVLHPAAIEALELFRYKTNSYFSEDNKGTVFSLINRCKTSGGSKLLETWLRRPLTNVNEIEERQDILESLLTQPFIVNFIRKNCLEHFCV
uniref:MUTSd domain-containing protein n=1 Tax=Strongyloides papillosus TaxID=174720 RepID=A0A0N5CBN7_STREA